MKEKKGKEEEKRHIELEDNNTRARALFPLFCLDVKLTASDSSSDQRKSNKKREEPNKTPNHLIAIGGGGGASKTGITNGLSIIFVDRKGTASFDSSGDLCSIETGLSVPKCVAFQPNGNLIAVGVGNKCHLYDLKESKLVEIKKVQSDSMNEQKEGNNLGEQKCLKFDRIGKTLYTGGVDGIIRVWEIPSMKLVTTFETIEEEIDEIECDDEGYIFTLTRKKLQVWKTDNTSKPYASYDLAEEQMKGVKVILKGLEIVNSQIIVGKICPGLRSWIIRLEGYQQGTLRLTQQQVVHRYYHFNTIAISPDRKYIATGTSNETVAVFDAKTLRLLMEVKEAHTFFVTKVAFTEDSKNVVSVSADYSCAINPIVPTNSGLDATKMIAVLSLLILLLAILYQFYLK